MSTKNLYMKPKKGTQKKSHNSVQTQWDLTLLYTGADDPRIEKDVRATERACAGFAKKYADRVFVRSNKTLLQALSDYEKLAAMPEGDRPIRYFMFRREIDATDAVAEKYLNKLSDRLTKAGNQLVFFTLALGALPKEKQTALLRDPAFIHYRYYLKNVFEDAQYNLTEPEEKILNLKSLPASQLWVAGTEKILNKATVTAGDKTMPLMEALTQVGKLPKKQRRALWTKAMEACRSYSEIAENELNAIVLNKKINDELRGYKYPYSATVFGNENTEKSISTLVGAVTDRFDISERFYTLKAKMMKEKNLLYADRSASYGKEITIPFTEAVDTLRDVFYALKPEYGKILDAMLARGQIDVYPKAGKTGGAFCAGGTNQPTFVLLNQVDDMRSLTTFAHEMGHAIHTERSKQQPTLYQDYSTATAETASTLFENLVFESLLGKLTERQQIVALHDKLNDDMASIMRQIAFFNYEQALHEAIRREGSLTKEEMAALMQKHLAAYLGKSVTVSEIDGYSFVYISHFRMFFYVYTYAYGSLVSNVLSARWKQNASYIDQIDTFLCAGGSASPETIFKNIGINTSAPSFFKDGLVLLDQKVTELEQLVEKYK